MSIVCFVSGSGTNYREIARAGTKQRYLVFTNRPGCAATAIAEQNHHEVIELSHVPHLKTASLKYGPGRVPRNAPERIAYEQEVSRLIEDRLGGKPDLICLAGYDQWVTDWTVDRYFPRLLNIHPGDTTRGHYGLHWIPTARAILAGEKALRATLFFVDKGEDTGPVLAQSAPLGIEAALKDKPELIASLEEVRAFSDMQRVRTYDGFAKRADTELHSALERVCVFLQEALKAAGDWRIYPFGAHELIGKGRVRVEGRTVYIDGKALPEYGYRLA